MTRQDIREFMRRHALAVLATVSVDRTPEAALVRIAVTDDLEIVFDTVRSSRKHRNLLRNPHIAFVLGWEGETTLQYEGVATELHGAALRRYEELYMRTFPDGHVPRRSRDIACFVVRPTWVRFSDFEKQHEQVVEFTFAGAAGRRAVRAPAAAREH
jgi:pyridoxine/pyridoxamine 5'-phosphate oxidase